jgi:hypothetical protein
MPSDFRNDRDFNTPPDADDPYEAKVAYQRELRRRWEAMEKPSDILNFPLPTGDWRTDPHGVPPQYYEQKLKRYAR